MRKIINLLALLLFFSVSVASAAFMADISYTYLDNGGGNYTFDFTVHNTSDSSSTGALDFFLIDFDADNIDTYSNISWLNDKGWTSGAYEPDSSFGGLPGGVNADDALVFGGAGGIMQGGSLSGFTVNFDYSGGLLPKDQLFSWIADFGTSDDDNGGIEFDGYWVEEELYGMTRFAGQIPPPAIPEPSTFILFGAGLAAFWGLRRKKR